MLRRLMDVVYQGHVASQNVTTSLDDEQFYIQSEALGVIIRPEGPIMTVTILEGVASTYGNIVAAGLIHLRSNHRVIAVKTTQLGCRDIDQYYLQYVDGKNDTPTPAFAIGDLSATDQALRYLMSCWALTGCRQEGAAGEPTPLADKYLLQMRTLAYPAPTHSRPWPTDSVLEQALQPTRLMANVS